MQPHETMPIQLICLFSPSTGSPAESRPTPLTSPTLGSSSRLLSRRDEAALLLSSPEDVSALAEEEASDAVEETSAREGAAVLTGAWLCTAGALDGGGAVLEGGGGVALEGGGGAALDGGGAALEGAGGASLEGAGGATLSGSACETGSSGCDAMGSAVPKNRDAVSTAHRTAQIDQTKKPVRFVFLLIFLILFISARTGRRPAGFTIAGKPGVRILCENMMPAMGKRRAKPNGRPPFLPHMHRACIFWIFSPAREMVYEFIIA